MTTLNKRSLQARQKAQAASKYVAMNNNWFLVWAIALCQNCSFTDSVEAVITFRCFFNKRVLFSCFGHWQAQGLRRSTLFLPVGVSLGIRLVWT